MTLGLATIRVGMSCYNYEGSISFGKRILFLKRTFVAAQPAKERAV